MLEHLQPYLVHPLARSVIAGVLAAALVDIHAFHQWQNWRDVRAYNWKTASFRWFQGAVAGLLAGLGIATLV